MNRRPKSRLASAFTLIELLVVIAIIAILAAILFPVFAQARSKARQITGTSNAKQVSLAILQYLQDYDEKFPRAGWDCGPEDGGDNTPASFPPGGHNGCGATAWQNVTSPYHKNGGVFTSPGDASTTTSFDTTADGNFSLLFNDLLSHALPTDNNGYADNNAQKHFADGQSLAQIAGPADCVLLAEGHCGWNKAAKSGNAEDKAKLWNGVTDLNSKWYREQTLSGYQTFILAGRSYGGWGQRIVGAPFYNGGGNVAFTDGHAKYIKMADDSGVPILCSSLPWSKSMDPLQRNADKNVDHCKDPQAPIGDANSGANWH